MTQESWLLQAPHISGEIAPAAVSGDSEVDVAVEEGRFMVVSVCGLGKIRVHSIERKRERNDGERTKIDFLLKGFLNGLDLLGLYS